MILFEVFICWKELVDNHLLFLQQQISDIEIILKCEEFQWSW